MWPKIINFNLVKNWFSQHSPGFFSCDFNQRFWISFRFIRVVLLYFSHAINFKPILCNRSPNLSITIICFDFFMSFDVFLFQFFHAFLLFFILFCLACLFGLSLAINWPVFLDRFFCMDLKSHWKPSWKHAAKIHISCQICNISGE